MPPESSAAARSPLVGRTRELAELKRLARAAAGDEGALVLVSGEAGVGKTALVDAALAGSAFHLAQAAASPVATPALGPVATMLRSLRREAPEMFAGAAEHAGKLGGLLSDSVPSEAVAERAALADAIGETFVAMARVRPLALVFDDLHWADHATLDLLPRLAQAARAAPLLIVAIYRSDALSRSHPVRAMRDALRRARLLKEVVVEPLERAEILQLVEDRFGQPPSPAIGATICERSGGLPLFVEALVDALRSRDCFDAGTEAVALPLPETVRDAILVRVDALPTSGRRAAEAAAVVGSELPLELLARVNESDEGIEALLESGLLVERQAGAAAFRTPLARDAVYAAIQWTRRRSLHRRVAEVLGENEQSAEHWRAAGEPERARSALLASARRSRALHAHRDTVGLLQRALDLWPPGEEEVERLGALDQLGDAAQLAGLFPEALRAWREVAETAAAAGGPLAAARALRKVANLHELNCDWARALDVRQDAMAAFAAADDHAEAANEGITAAIRLRLSGRSAAGLQVVGRAEAEAEASGRADLKVRVAALKGNLEARLGRFAEGIATVRSALEAAIALGRPALAGEIYQRLADAIERTSDFRAGAATNREGIAFCEERDAAGGVVACLTCMSWILIRGGEWEQALEACHRLLASPACNPIARSAGLGLAGIAHVLRGELRKGAPLLAEADVLAQRFENALVEVDVRWGLALHDAITGDDAAAAERCRWILARRKRMDEGHAAMPVLRWSASCFARVGDRKNLRACAEALGESAAAFSHSEPLSALAHSLGEIAWLDGDTGRAADQFEHAISLLEDMQLPRERVESQLRAAAACAAIGRREAAVAHAREAARGAERLGARPLAEAAATQLRALGEALSAALGPRTARRAEQGGLTARQLQILREISKGHTDKEIARSLRLSPRTVEMHVAHALETLDCRSRAEAVRKAAELGVLGRAAR